MAKTFDTLDLKMRWQDQKAEKRDDGQWYLVGRPAGARSITYRETPPNIPGFTVIALTVTFDPAGGTPPHYHGGAAVFGTMIKGRSVMQMVCPDHDPDSQGTGAKVYEVGESWYEPPGCHHVRSHNASDTEECVFVASFVIETEKLERLGVMGALVQIDEDVREKGGMVGKL